MHANPTQPEPLLVACIGAIPSEADLRDRLPDSLAISQFDALRDLGDYAEARPWQEVAVLIVDAAQADPREVFAEALQNPRLAAARCIVLTGAAECDGLGDAIDSGQLHAVVRLPASTAELADLLISAAAPALEAAGLSAERLRPDADPASRDLLDDFSAEEEELIARLVAAVDSAVGPVPRLVLPPGVRLTRQGHEPDGVYLLLEGTVSLTRETPSETLLLHKRSTGRVIGLLSLAGHDKSYFTSTSTTEVVVVLLSMEQLRLALARDPHVVSALAATGIQSLSLRLLRSEELQVERNELNWQLGREQKRLRQALDKLRSARLELVSQTRFAMLGELSAGIAHELNNPVAALIAASEHMSADIDQVLESHPARALLAESASEGIHHGALSTAQEREIRRQIEAQIHDPEVAFRLVAAGVTDPSLVANATPEELTLIEAAANIGTASRNIRAASARIAQLVGSLRSYSRPENEHPQPTNVSEGLDEAIALASHRLRGLEVTKNYDEVPEIAARPSQLGQVWTNLLINAADAAEEGGHIEVAVTAPDPDWVQVEVIDDGPGIPPENVAKIFDPRFTTKKGTVRYGLGIGLSLTKQLVENHGGAITVDSAPGRTVFTVGLPVEGPPEPQEPLEGKQ